MEEAAGRTRANILFAAMLLMLAAPAATEMVKYGVVDQILERLPGLDRNGRL